MERLFDGWQREVDATLAAVVPDVPVALVNFPNHRNAGDSAIWLAEREALRRLGRRVAYRCAWNGFSRSALRRRVGDGPILLNGGGNFGDLYAGQQGLREQILATCRDNPVVQLPESIWFRDPQKLDDMRRLVEAHGQVTILCRDRRSEALAREHFAAQVAYCPDMVLAFGTAQRPVAPTVDVLWLARRDAEAVSAGPGQAADVEACDWLSPFPGESEWPDGHRLDWALTRRSLDMFGRSAWAASRFWTVPARSFDRLAWAWVDRARRILARGRVVVTDRLHGHVLAAAMGIPTVVLDSSYGKVHDIARECTAAIPSTHLASTATEALEIARRVAAETAEADAAEAAGSSGV